VIRPAGPGDAARYAALAAQLGYPLGVAEAAAALTRHQGRTDRTTLVADDPEVGVVGWIGCQLVDCGYQPIHGDVSGLVVDEAFRGRRVGAELLRAADQWFHDRGAAWVIIRSGGQRERAHRFYDREGCRRIKTQVVFRRDL